MSETKFEIYTDGSCIGNPGPGGWGVLIFQEGKEIAALSGNEKDSTNNRMEMTAVIEALKWLHKNAEPTKDQATIHSDSNLIIQTLNSGWKKKANTDLWAEIEKLSAWTNIKWVWVKAHATNKNNNRVDELAFSEAKKLC